MDNYTDGQLYIHYQKYNDETSFRMIYDKYREGLLLFLYGIVQNMDDAEELMMDTFAILSSGTARYKERKDVSFKTWLYAVARNRARMHLRHHRPILVSLDDEVKYDPDVLTDMPENTLLNDERNLMLYKALEQLNPEYRQVLYLIYFEDLKAEQISRIMKKTVKQVYNLTTRGKAGLKDNLERMGYTWDM